MVLGHLLGPLASLKDIRPLYDLLYTFHIPAFALISGYFSKGYGTAKHRESILRHIFVPYLIFDMLYMLFARYILLENVNLNVLATPYWLMWYLLSLFTWNLILPYFTRLKHPILWAFTGAILVGYVDAIGYGLSLSRSIVFFPFFLAGFYLQKKDFTYVKSFPGAKLYASLYLLGLTLFYYFYSELPSTWLYGCYSYSALGHPEWYSGLYRMALYLLSSLAIVSFFILVPSKELPLTSLGKESQTIYLLHGFAVKALIGLGIYHMTFTFWHKLGLVVLASLLTLLLGSPAMRTLIHFLTNPRMDWMFRRKEHAPQYR